MDALDSVRGPGGCLLQGADEHLVESHGISAKFLDHIVGVDDIPAALGHLLHDTLEGQVRKVGMVSLA